MPKNILVDTSAIFAIIHEDDLYHGKAQTHYSDFLDQGDRIITNSYVLSEASALDSSAFGFEALREFVGLIQGRWELLWVDSGTHWEAWRRMDARGGGGLSLVDWSVIVTAEQTQSTIFTFDSDFAQEGLRVIPVRSG